VHRVMESRSTGFAEIAPARESNRSGQTEERPMACGAQSGGF
jgi:hypothetical protein